MHRLDRLVLVLMSSVLLLFTISCGGGGGGGSSSGGGPQGQNNAPKCLPGEKGTGSIPACMKGSWLYVGAPGYEYSVTNQHPLYGSSVYSWEVLDDNIVVIKFDSSDNGFLLARTASSRPKISGRVVTNGTGTGGGKAGLLQALRYAAGDRSGVSGMPVTLTNSDRSERHDTTTDGTGNFEFSQLLLPSGCNYQLSGTSVSGSFSYPFCLHENSQALGEVALTSPGKYNLVVRIYGVNYYVNRNTYIYWAVYDNDFIFAREPVYLTYVIQNIGIADANNVTVRIDSSQDHHIAGSMTARITSLKPGEVVASQWVLDAMAKNNITPPRGVLDASSDIHGTFFVGQVPGPEYIATLSTTVTDSLGGMINGTIPLTVYRDRDALFVCRENVTPFSGLSEADENWAAIIYPGRRNVFVQAASWMYNGWTGCRYKLLPMLTGESAYMVTHNSGPNIDNTIPETNYYVWLGQAARDAYTTLTSSVSVSTHEPNNTIATATTVTWGSAWTSFLSYKDTDVYKINFPSTNQVLGAGRVGLMQPLDTITVNNDKFTKILIEGTRAYRFAYESIAVNDISDPYNPTHLVTAPTLTPRFVVNSGLIASAASGSYVYYINGSRIVVQDIGDAVNNYPAVADVYVGSIQNLKTVGTNTLLVSHGTNTLLPGGGVDIYNISDPRNPALVSSGDLTNIRCGLLFPLYYPYGNGCYYVYQGNVISLDGKLSIQGNYAYGYGSPSNTNVADSIMIYDISNPLNPALINSVSVGAYSALAVAGTNAYFISDAGVDVYDVSNPLQASFVKRTLLSFAHDCSYDNICASPWFDSRSLTTQGGNLFMGNGIVFEPKPLW